MSVAAAEEIDALRDSVNRFMKSEVNPFMNDIEKSGEFPRGLVKKSWEFRFLWCSFSRVSRWLCDGLRCGQILRHPRRAPSINKVAQEITAIGADAYL